MKILTKGLDPTDNSSSLPPSAREVKSGIKSRPKKDQGKSKTKKEKLKQWSHKDSLKLYNINKWGMGHFSVNEEGHLTVRPNKNKKLEIDFSHIIKEMQESQIPFPAIIRFHEILRHQVISLNKQFKKTIQEADYDGKYFGVFPIKVNQMREVVEEIVKAGKTYNYGLEAGSKAELLAALAMNTNPHSLTVLNGYKDEDYLKLALLGRKMGKKIIVVIERLVELPLLCELSEKMKVKPLIGFRSKLFSKGPGKWSRSSGEFAKFGLTSSEMLKGIDYLKEKKLLDCLQLFHFHMGSQIPDIQAFKDVITEGVRTYISLIKHGCPIEYFDVGGGLGVDYEGKKATSHSSINYNLKDYVEDVVYITKQLCDLEKVPHPHLVTESGRAVTAHHSCVVFNIFGHISPFNHNFLDAPSESEHIILKNMRELFSELNQDNIQETYNDALQAKNDMQNAFKLGILKLEEKAQIETLFWKICLGIDRIADQLGEVPKEIREIKGMLAEQYLGNFSVFQSAADTWGIGQVLPVVPLTRLNEKPTKLCTLADITCDSDGKIDCFVHDSDLRTLPIHPLKENEPYFMGLFLTGAYQDIMGDIHNLFGRLNEVHIFSDPEDPSQYYIEEIIEGNSTQEVLSFLQYNPKTMAFTIKKQIDTLILKGFLRPKEGIQLSDFYNECLKKYTYLLQTPPAKC